MLLRADSVLVPVCASTHAAGPGTLPEAVVTLLLLVLAMLFQARALRRPGVCRMCVGSLLVFLSGYIALTILKQVAEWYDLPSAARVGGGVIVLQVIGVSMGLAIIGLARRDRSVRLSERGGGHAVCTLLLSAWMAVSMSVSAIKFLETQPARNGETVVSGAKRYPDHNFRLEPPSRDWVLFPNDMTFPEAVVTYRSASTGAGFAVLAGSNGSRLSRVELMAEQQFKLRSTGILMTVEKEEEAPSAGSLMFRRSLSSLAGMRDEKGPVFFDSWVAATSRHCYSLISWGPVASREFVTREAAAWAGTFTELADQPDVEPWKPFPDAEVPAEGYASALAAEGWKVAPVYGPGPSTLNARKGMDHLQLIPVPLPAGIVLRDGDLEHRLLKIFTAGTDSQVELPVEVTNGGITGREFGIRGAEDAIPVRYRARIFRVENMAWLLTTWGPEGTPEESRQRGLEAVRLFPRIPGAVRSPAPKDFAKARSGILKDVGNLCYMRQEYAKSILVYREARDLDPEDADTAWYIISAYRKQSRGAEALTELRAMLKESPLGDSETLRAELADLEEDCGDPAAAAAAWKGLFASGHKSEDHLVAWVRALRGQEKNAEALAVLDDYAKNRPSPRLAAWRASLLAALDRYDEAFDTLNFLINSTAPDRGALYLKGELENEAGRYAEAEKTADRLIGLGEDTARAHLIAGWSEWHRKAWKSANEEFEKAAGKSPEDEAVKDALAMSARALGQGTAEVSAEPLEPVALPPCLVEAMKARPEPPPDFTKGRRAFYQERFTGCFYESGKPVRVTHYYKVKVLDQAGVDTFSTLSLTFKPSAETVHVNKLIVRDESGAVVSEGTTADTYTTGESGGLATGAEVLRVPVSGLRRGGTVEAVITVRDKFKSTVPPFRRDLLAAYDPSLVRGWFVTGDTEAFRVEPAGGLQRLEGDRALAFMVFDQPAYRQEEYAAPAVDWQPWVAAGPRDTDWKTLATEYYQRIADRLEPDDSTRDLADRLVKDLATPADKAGAIIRYVQSTLTYKGLEFGSRGLVPSPVAKILNDHYGDCKDHTLLLYHLLKRAGIESYPALVDAGWPVRRSIASLDQFEHMILYVPDAGVQPWIDATEDWLDLTVYSPESLGGRDALVMDPKNPRFETIPKAKPSEVRAERELRPGKDGALDVVEKRTMFGAAAAWWRGWFMEAAAPDHKELVGRQWDSLGAFRVTGVDLENAEDLSKPFVVTLHYTATDAVDPVTRRVCPPLYAEREYLGIETVENRLSPFNVSPGTRFESRTVLTGGLRMEPSAAEAPLSGTGLAGDWNLDIRPEENLVIFTATCPPLQAPAARWGEFQEARRVLTDRLKRPQFLLEKTPPAAGG